MIFRGFLKTENTQDTEEDESKKKIEGKNDDKLKETLELKDPIHVHKWYNYSSKYGLGYVLTNGSVGVYFNDGIKMFASSNE